MRTSTLFAAFAALITTAASAAPASAPASGQKDIVLKIEGQMEQAYTDAKGNPAKRLVPLTKILPGDEIVYTISFNNVGKQLTSDVVINDPIPADVAYRDGTAFGPGTEIEFSADGGKSFGKPAALKVKGADGKERAATASDYTHIRWQMLAAVAPGQKGFVRFRATVR